MTTAIRGLRRAPEPPHPEPPRRHGWRGSGVPIEPSRCLHDLFLDQVERAPDAVAVRGAGVRLTYAELNARAERLADRLAEAGVRPEELVAVHVERSAELPVALLGVLKAGAAYLPLEAGSPPSRTALLLADARPRLVLTLSRLRHELPATPLPVLSLDEWEGRPPAPPRRPLPVHVDGLAYVSYTSGSTGRPKGVCATHAAVARFVRRPNWAEFRPDDVWLHMAPAAFDASTLELYGALVNGAAVALYPPGPVLPDTVARTLADEEVSILWLTAGLFRRMVDVRLDAFRGARHVVAGGDVVSPAHVQRLLEAHPHLLFTNGYGPTENTILTACWTTREAVREGTVPVGRPVGGTRVALLDAGLRPVAPEAAGRLFTGGVGLARCYLGRPKETAERFVPDPEPEAPGARMYDTGDLARWRPDGTLEFLGRGDHQVKIQGYRVEPGEVEATLARHPAVREAVVVPHDDGRGGRHLAAYFVTAAPDAPSTDLVRELRAWARAQLPAYMVPRVLARIPAIPLTEVGKLDRDALPSAANADRGLSSDYAPPRTELEARLAEVWGRVLGYEPVGIDDDVFELGGHSLLVAEFIGLLEAELGIEVPSRTVYLQPTVAELARALERSGGEAAEIPSSPTLP